VRLPASVLACLLMAGCAGIVEKAKTTDVSCLESFESDSSYHNLWYDGSDENFHYFTYLECSKILIHLHYYKIERSRLNLDRTFPLGEQDPYVVWPGTIARAAADAGAAEPGEEVLKAGSTKAK